MMLRALALGVGLLVTAAVSAGAQSAVTGRVVDSFGQPLSSVSVTMLPETGGVPTRTLTRADGTYRVENLQDGTYRIDFALARFDVTRRNHVRVRNGVPVFGDATLHTSRTCHCSVVLVGLPRVFERSGQVLDTAGRPLARTRLELEVPILADASIGPSAGWSMYRNVSYADAEGRFSVLVPIELKSTLTASDTGFGPVTEMVTGSGAGPIVFRLPYVGVAGVEDHERFPRACRCEWNLFTHPD
jgi:hypothetical protein